MRAGEFRTFAVLTLAMLCAAPATAQSDPWVGRWGNPHCGGDATEIVLSRSELDLTTFEARCAVRGVRRKGALFEVDARCEGEGSPTRVTFTLRVDGDTLAFVGQKGLQFDPKRFKRCDRPAARAVNAPSAPPQSSGSLPLLRGYYVAEGTPCGQASNATLQLLRRNAMGAARTMCEFGRVEKAGANRYRVTERCDGETETVTYDIAGDRAFTQRRVGGAAYSARYCPQSELPAPWRDNDVSDLIR